MGSVKDLRVLKKQKERRAGVGRFVFSDRYSVFDWGEMPDHLPNKGTSLCLIGAYCFEEAEKKRIKTHYRGLVKNGGKTVKLNEIEKPTNKMEVDLVRVIRPKFEKGKYDYSVFAPDLTNFLIPLEIIYRNGLPEGSSVFKRLEKGQATYQELGLDHYPKPGEKLKKPIFDLSTKLEEEDRYITWRQAQEMAKLSDKEVEEIKRFLSAVNSLITKIAAKADLVNEDGKMELAYDSDRKLVLVDVVGTLDECRFTYDGLSVSKEIARQYYKKTLWYADVQEAKKKAAEQGIQEWKKLCKSQPQKLPPQLKQIIADMYASTANAFLGRDLFDSPKLKDVIGAYEEWVGSK